MLHICIATRLRQSLVMLAVPLVLLLGFVGSEIVCADNGSIYEPPVAVCDHRSMI